jgi:hypothetical protein
MAVGVFLTGLAEEAHRRGYHFDTAKILERGRVSQIDETDGQLLLEWAHLNEKLRKRAPHLYQRFQDIRMPEPHPLFRLVPGAIRDWEKQRVNNRP